MNRVEPWIQTFIKDRDLVVLRHKSGKAVDVSYTEDGLKWATDPDGNMLYYFNCRLDHTEVAPDLWKPYIHPINGGSVKPNRNMIVEKFVPRNHTNRYHQSAEFRACNKGLRLLYTNNEDKVGV